MRQELERHKDPRLHREAERVMRRNEADEVREAEVVERMEDLPDNVNEEMDHAEESDHGMKVNPENDLFNIMYEMRADVEIKAKLNERGETPRIPRRWDDDVKKMNEALSKEGIGAAVHEIYSPKRVNAIAELMDIVPGMSLDLTTNDIDGKPWDFNIEENELKQKR